MPEFKTYQIWKDNRLIGSFPEGAQTRFGRPMDDEVSVDELHSCIRHHEQYRPQDGPVPITKYKWELRIVLPKGCVIP